MKLIMVYYRLLRALTCTTEIVPLIHVLNIDLHQLFIISLNKHKWQLRDSPLLRIVSMAYYKTINLTTQPKLNVENPKEIALIWTKNFGDKNFHFYHAFIRLRCLSFGGSWAFKIVVF